MTHVDVLVLGGGLAGLCAARELVGAGVDRVLVLERDDVPGGLVRTARGTRYTIDHLPHIFFSQDRDATALYRELVPDSHQQRSRLGVYTQGRHLDYPFQLHVHQLPHASRLACLEGYLEVVGAPSPPPGADFGSFLASVYGRPMVELLFRPYNEKLWRVPLEQLATDWVGAKIDAVDRADMARSFLGSPTEEKRAFGAHSDFLYPSHGGMQRLAEALVEDVGAHRVRTGAEVTSVDLQQRRAHTHDDVVHFDRAVWTLPLSVVPRLTGMGSEPAGRLVHNRVHAFHFAARELVLPDRHWIYVLDEHLAMYRITRTDRIDPRYGEGPYPFIVEVASAPHERPDPAALLRRVSSEIVGEGMVPGAGDLEHLGTHVYAPAYVVHDHQRPAAVAAVQDTLAAHGVVTAGRFGHWSFYNMDRALLSGRAAAREVSNGR